MKKIVIAQALILLSVILLGLTLKFNLESDIRIFHRVFGILAALVSMTTAGFAFKTNQSGLIKTLAVGALLLTISAAVGGSSLLTASNYNLSYAQMIISGSLAFLLTLVLFYKVK